MTMKHALQTILAIALFGLAFSGYLSYQELFATTRAATCPSPGQPGTVLGYPACVYGFFMYLAVVAVSVVGLGGGRAQSRRDARADAQALRGVGA